MRRAVAIFVMASVAGCGGGIGFGTQQMASEVPSGASDLFIRVGQGYDKNSETFKVQCVRSDPTVHGGSRSATIEMDHSVDSQKVYHDLGFDIGTHAYFKIGAVGIDTKVESDIAETASSDDYSETFIFRATYNLGNDSLDESNYKNTQAGDDAQKSLRWTEVCGDEFVYQITNGARFYVVYRLDFASKSDKDWFHTHAHLDANGGITVVNLDGDVHDNLSKVSKRTRVHVAAFQSGGDPTQLSAVIAGTGATLQERQDGAKAVLSCSFEHLDACNQLLSNAILYTNTDTPNGLPKQLDSNPSNPLLYITKPWTDIGRNTTPGILTTEITDARAQLGDKFDKIHKAKVRVDRLLDSGLRMPDAQLADLQTWQKTLSDELTAVNNAVLACYDNLTYDPSTSKPLPDKVTACQAAVAAVGKDGTLSLPPDSVLDNAGRYLIDEKAQATLPNLPPKSDYVTVDGGRGVYREYGQCVVSCTWKRGCQNRCSLADVYWSDDTDVHVVSGAVLDKYKAVAGPTGTLGFPTTDTTTTDGSTSTSQYNQFENGAILSTNSGTFALHGAIYEKYFDLPDAKGNPPATKMGAFAGFLGSPVADQTTGPRGGELADFENGSIYWSQSTGAHEVHGAIRSYWLQWGGAGPANTGGSPMLFGYPLTDQTPNGDNIGQFNEFEFGRVYWHPTLGAAGVSNEMRVKYDESRNNVDKYLHGVLGYPTGQYQACISGACGWATYFQHGAIYWSAATGAHEIAGKLWDKYHTFINATPGNSDLLGFPTYDEGTQYRRPNDASTPLIHASWFQHGVITFLDGQTEAFVVLDATHILSRWMNLGGWYGCLGLPVEDTWHLNSGAGKDDYHTKFEGGLLWGKTYDNPWGYPTEGGGCGQW